MASRRLLIPREHGAWVQMGLPAVSALWIGGLTPLAAALTGAAILLFVSHEPLVVLLGQRGDRLRRRSASRARIWLATLLTGGAALLLGGIWVAPEAVRVVLAAPMLAGAGALGFSLAGAQKSAAGEALVVVALASWAAPIAVAGGATSHTAMVVAGTWITAFELLTLVVRTVLRHRDGRGRRAAVAYSGVAALSVVCVGAAAFAATLAWLPWPVATALTPIAAVVVWTALVRPHPRALRRIGWASAAATTLTLLILGLGMG